MKVMILGIDGYLGWPLALHLMNKGHKVSGIDNFSRRERVHKLGGSSLTPILLGQARYNILCKKDIMYYFDELSVSNIESFLQFVQPDAIVHLAEQPSAPWSMLNIYNAVDTQIENVIGTLKLLWYMKKTCPEAHLIKLGTMGEYGTPNCDIPEGEIPESCTSGGLHILSRTYGENISLRCPMSGLQFPRKAGSWYHLTKVHDSFNIEFACRNWGLRSTDIMQGPVFGVRTEDMEDETMLTRFDYDECFGTIINRFCAQAIVGHPLTIYGKGGQTRGYLPLKDSIFCMTLAIENPPKAGEYRVFNQFERTYSANELAEIVQKAAYLNEIEATIAHYENPRKEAETHYYNPHRNKLVDLGYQPTKNILPEVTKLIKDILPFKDRVIADKIVPEIRWDTEHRKSKIV
jgi:nucleoside-diphosphate-sugar epimerase